MRSTGSLFLFGIVVGAVALLARNVLLAGAPRAAGPRPDAPWPAPNAKGRSSTAPATPGSNTNSEPTELAVPVCDHDE